MYKQLRRQLIANNTGIGAPFAAITIYFDTDRRTTYATQTDSLVDDPAELAKDEEVFRYEYRPGKTRIVRYDGNGSVYTENVSGPGGGTAPACTLEAVVNPSSVSTSIPNLADASTDVTGRLGAPPFSIQLEGLSGQANGYSFTRISPSEYYPARFRNLPTGKWSVTVTDAQGCVSIQSLEVYPGLGTGRGIVLESNYSGDPVNGSGYQLIYLFNDQTIVQSNYNGGGNDGDFFLITPGTLIDAFLLDDGGTWRKVFADGNQGNPQVYFEDSTTAKSGTLELDNLILFNPDTLGEQNGGVLVEVIATALPVSFRLAGTNAAGPIAPQVNQTGSFDGLAQGDYTVTATDAAGGSLPVPFSLKLRYGLWQQLVYDDLESRPLRLELWLRDYAGPVGSICGQEVPVTLKSDGLSSSVGGQGDIPASVGTSAQLELKVPPGLLERVVIGDDRLCRVDVYYNNKLEFRGYVQPDIYEAPLLDGLQPVSLTATDGLAALKDTYMLGHIGQRLNGHRPVLNTLLHCLSRCEVALPVRIYTNRRDAAMSDADAPELAATTNRVGYYDDDKGEPIYQRTVVDALTQALGGTLCQRGGAWEIRSALEALLDAPGRAYLPAGTPRPAVVALAPSGTIRPPARNRLHWLKGDQAKQVRAGWKSLVGKTDAGWLKNAFPAGAVFSDKYAWLEDGSKLRPISGWKPASGTTFPLVLTRGGDKGQDYATQWLRSSAPSSQGPEYLQSPPLPLVAGTEAVPAFLVITARLLPLAYVEFAGMAIAGTATKARLPYEIIIDGQSVQGVQYAEIPVAQSASAKPSEVVIPLQQLLPGVQSALLRVYSWYAPPSDALTLAPVFAFGVSHEPGDVVKEDFGTGIYRLFQAKMGYNAVAGIGIRPLPSGYDFYWQEIPASDVASGNLLITSFGVQLRPQNATWEGEDNFRADGPGGNIRPTEALEVYHPDAPLAAGLYGGNLFAFGKGLALADGTMSTSWARKIDKAPSPLFEANVLDGLALRAGASRLLKGTLLHRGVEPPRLLDSLDTPFDVSGRRFFVATWEWAMKEAEVAVSLTEIGPGADAQPPELPDGVRLTHRAYEYAAGKYAPVPRRAHSGRFRVRH